MARKRRRSRVSGLPFDMTTIAGAAGGAVIGKLLSNKVETLKANPKMDGALKVIAGGFLATMGGISGAIGVGMIAQGALVLGKDVAPDSLGSLPAGVGPNRTFIAGTGNQRNAMRPMTSERVKITV